MKEAKGLNLKNSMPYCVKHVLYDVVFLVAVNLACKAKINTEKLWK